MRKRTIQRPLVARQIVLYKQWLSRLMSKSYRPRLAVANPVFAP
jgi:hypothetical protein